MQDAVRHAYEDDAHDRFRRQRKVRGLELSFLADMRDGAPGDRVLDIGCGSGIPFTRWLADHGCDVTGIDLAQAQIEAARRHVPDARFHRADILDTPVDRRFDAAVCLYALVHVPRDRHAALFQDIAARLPDGGQFLVTVSREEKPPHPVDFPDRSAPINALPLQTTLAHLRDAGFTVRRHAPIRDEPDLLPWRLVLAEATA